MNTGRRQLIGGLLLFGAAAAALALANSPIADGYFAFAKLEPLRAAAIFLFFLSVGIELRHEIVDGSLRKPRQSITPILAAVGGMVVPVVIFSLVNAGTNAASGWGVPMSSDMAFALGVLAIAGRWLPRQIRTYVLSIAVVDDSLTILVIAIFYASSFHLLSLASLAGVLLGLLVGKLKSIQTRLEVIVAFAALPIFALMSAGVQLGSLPASVPSTLVIGIALAMIFGKPLGIIGTTWLVTKSGLGKLPKDTSWKDLFPALLVFGMCFTLAMVMTELSFAANPSLHSIANICVIASTVFMAIVSTTALLIRKSLRVE